MTKIRMLSTKDVAKSRDGVHAKPRVTSAALFFDRFFHAYFNGQRFSGGGGSAIVPGIDVADSVLIKLWAAFRELYPDQSVSVIEFWQKKVAEELDRNWDIVTYYSAEQDADVTMTLPLSKVLGAIATLLLDEENCFFSIEDGAKRREEQRARLAVLFDNMKQVKEATSLCHTGVRDAIVMSMDSRQFRAFGKMHEYRFPENTSSFLRSLLVEQVEQGLDAWRLTQEDSYRTALLVWIRKPEDDSEMPDELKKVVTCHLDKVNITELARAALMSIGIHPDSVDARRDREFVFGPDGLESLELHDVVGSKAYWHNVRRLFHYDERFLQPRVLAFLTILKKLVSAAKTDAHTDAINRLIQSFIMVQDCLSLLSVYENELRFCYEADAIEVIDGVYGVVGRYFMGANPGLISDEDESTLKSTQELVKRYNEEPFRIEFKSFFSILFQRNVRHWSRHADKLVDPEFMRWCQLSNALLKVYLSADTLAGEAVGRVTFSLEALNHYLLYLLTTPGGVWFEGAAEVLPQCVDFIENKLGVSEADPDEREHHARLKEDSYPKEFIELLKFMARKRGGEAATDDMVVEQITFCLKYNLGVAARTILEALPDEQQEVVKQRLNEQSRFSSIVWLASMGLVASVEFVLSIGQSIERVSEGPGYTALMIAAKHGHTKTARLLLDRGADVNAKSRRSTTPLMYAAVSGELVLVKLFLEKGASRDQVNNRGLTAVMMAAGNGNMEVVNYLLGDGASLESASPAGPTPLLCAAQGGHVELVQALINRGADVSARCGGRSALLWAAKGNHIETVKVLLAHGADARVCDNLGDNALTLAVCFDYRDMVGLLLKERLNLNLNHRTYYGQTALMIAASRGSLAVVNALLSRGANVHYENNCIAGKRVTALYCAIQGGHMSVAKALIDHGATMEGDLDLEEGALELAVSKNQKEIIKYWLNNKRERVSDEAVDTLLRWADENQCEDIADDLCEHISQVLLRAIELKCINVVIKILETRSIETPLDAYGYTSLMAAAAGGDKEMVAALLARGANVDVRDAFGCTAGMYASSDVVREMFASQYQKSKVLSVYRKKTSISFFSVGHTALEALCEAEEKSTWDMVKLMKERAKGRESGASYETLVELGL